MAEQEFTTEELESEEWRDIPDFPHYQVSNLGRVRSQRAHHGRHDRWRIVRPTEYRGYPFFNLMTPDGRKGRKIHRLVMEAFVGPRPEGMECCHNDGDKTNNRLANLRWDTHHSNMRDMFQHDPTLGTAFAKRIIGKANARMRRKLGPEDTVPIFKAYCEEGLSYAQIAARYGVTMQTIAVIIRREHRWYVEVPQDLLSRAKVIRGHRGRRPKSLRAVS